MPQDGLDARPRAPQMPKSIAVAILKAIREVRQTETTGEGEEGSRQFRYATINDVLRAGHDALVSAGLQPTPMEVSYATEVVDNGLTKERWAHYGFRFRLVHESGESWVDEDDTRHISLVVPGSGLSAGKAQSLAYRDYLKGLLRIRTAEPEDVAVAAGDASPRASPLQRGAIPFTFGPSEPLRGYLPKEVKEAFDAIIAPQSANAKAQWLEANDQGMRQLCEVDKALWMRIRRAAIDDGKK